MSSHDPTPTGGSMRRGTIADIPVPVHATFVFPLVWFEYFSADAGDCVASALVFLGAVFGCVVQHDLGHALTARRFGVRTREFVLYPIGGIARLENIPGGKAERGATQEVLLARFFFVRGRQASEEHPVAEAPCRPHAWPPIRSTRPLMRNNWSGSFIEVRAESVE